jgi:hypothetical protein
MQANGCIVSRRLLTLAVVYQSYLLIVIAILECTSWNLALSTGQPAVWFWSATTALVGAACVIVGAWQRRVTNTVISRRGKALLWLPIALNIIAATRFLSPVRSASTATAFYIVTVGISAAVAWLAWNEYGSSRGSSASG